MIIESREPNSIYLIIKKDSVDSKKEFFECGDYLLVKGFSVERKKGRDLMGTLLSKRLYSQLNNLCQYENPILAIITSNIWKDFYFCKSRYIHTVYIGMLSTIAAKYPKVRIFQFDDDEQFAKFLVSLEKKLTEESKGERPIPISRKATSIQEVRENCVAQIPGVGLKMSKNLLDRYQSINAIANAEVKDLLQIDKLGPKSATKIKEALN